LIVPDWPLPPGVRAACSLREGGVSRGPYASLNLGDHVGDDADAVGENRARFATQLGALPVFLRQVHGTRTVELDLDTPDGTEADACWTHERGVACTIMVADCLPILFADRRGQAVAAAHAGWRGLAGGVVENAFEAFARGLGLSNAQAARETMVWLGPCIGPTAFEVGDEVRQAFGAHADRFEPHATGQVARQPAAAGARPPGGPGPHARARQRRRHRLVHRVGSLKVLFAPARPHQRALRRRRLARLTRRPPGRRPPAGPRVHVRGFSACGQGCP
jgi:YfiH family protein